MAIDRIGCRDIGDRVTVIESGYTGITLVVRKLTRFRRPAGRGRRQILREVDARFLTRDGDTLSAPLLSGADKIADEIVAILMQGRWLRPRSSMIVRVHPVLTSLLNIIKLLLLIGCQQRTNL
jgi:hypothetical protein